MSWYRASTISLTNGSTAVTGAATDFIANSAVGEGLLAPDGKVYEIAAIVSATALTLGSAYLGSTASGQSYAIIPSQSYLRDLALQAATLVNDYQSVLDAAGAGKFGDGTLGSPGIQFSSDSNTGLRRTGTDAMALVTGGVDRITVDAAGAVAVVASLSVAGSAVPTLTSTSTLTNKTLALGGNTISGTTAQFNTALTDGDFATLAGTETLTNKTLTSPVINGFTGTGNASITGTLSATGVVTSTYVGGSPALDASTATTGIKYVQVGNTGGALLIGVDSSVGSGLGTPATAYDAILRTNTALTIGNASAQFGRFSTTGLAVTGALSATGAISGTTAGVRLPTNSPVYFNAGYNTYIQELSAGNLQVVAGGTSIGNFTATGLAVTGALSATGSATIGTTAAQNGVIVNGVSTANGAPFILLFRSGSIETVLYAPSGGSHALGISLNPASKTDAALDAGKVAMFSTTGLAVTGAVSATEGITTGSYTVATRPAHAAGRIIHVTDGGAGAVFQGSAGGAWVNLG